MCMKSMPLANSTALNQPLPSLKCLQHQLSRDPEPSGRAANLAEDFSVSLEATIVISNEEAIPVPSNRSSPVQAKRPGNLISRILVIAILFARGSLVR